MILKEYINRSIVLVLFFLFLLAIFHLPNDIYKNIVLGVFSMLFLFGMYKEVFTITAMKMTIKKPWMMVSFFILLILGLLGILTQGVDLSIPQALLFTCFIHYKRLDGLAYTLTNVLFLFLMTNGFIFALTNIAPTMLLCVLLIVKSSDIGGLIFGRFLGRWNLNTTISERKTVEGCFGSFIAVLMFTYILSGYIGINSIYATVVISFTISVLAQIGDLYGSFLKRLVNIKDSGHVEGVGGVIDMLDSLIFLIPILKIIISFSGLSSG
jgi:CDP-diglyceride synthetase